MTQKYTRRQALAVAAGAALAMTGLTKTYAAAVDEGFDFALIGDVHYDKLTHHDMTWLANEHPGDVHQVQNYSKLSENIVPSLYDEIRSVIAEAKRPMPFTAHLGDLSGSAK